eukprot:scaffold123930_cov19-Tisochrysis_lutea.AAC.1
MSMWSPEAVAMATPSVAASTFWEVGKPRMVPPMASAATGINAVRSAAVRLPQDGNSFRARQARVACSLTFSTPLACCGVASVVATESTAPPLGFKLPGGKRIDSATARRQVGE